MATVGILHSRPEVMTARARLFLSVAAMRNLLVGVSILVTPELYSAPNRVFDLVREMLGLEVWGWAMVLTGVAAVHSVLAESRQWARGSIYASAAISGVWASALTIQFVELAGGTPRMSPMLPLLWLAVCVKDLILAWQPMRSPLEDVIRRTADKALTNRELDDQIDRIEEVIERSQRLSAARGDRPQG